MTDDLRPRPQPADRDDASTVDATTIAGPRDPLIDARIGPYRILQKIGEGGFGAVYIAEQEQPVRRRVAVKVLKDGAHGADVVARFEQERQALAVMDHPNIAKVFDGGTTSEGRPYFVMELVRGEPITTYCDRNTLSIPDRLALFMQVCNAVQHAHQKGVIHRDLKPSNILVTSTETDALVKVIDFGIAKATSAKLTDRTVFTRMLQMIGTPEYMSPEQADGSPDIDTRTDVYSLGVLLYELLTGTTPLSGRELRDAAFSEIQRLIRDLEPPRPSTRVGASGETLAATAAHRRVEPRRLSHVIRGDLDWIVMKALEKDRRRRYETANGLALDVGRYLAGEAVLAAPPSVAYRAQKFIRRHTAAVVAATLVAIALVLGIAGTSIGLVRADRERRQAEAMSAFLRDTLVASDPNQGGRQDRRVVDAVASAVTRLDQGAFTNQPEVEMRLRYTISNILNGSERSAEALANAEKGLALARRLHTGDHADVAEGLYFVARTQNGFARYEPAEKAAREALAMDRRLHPSGHLDVARDLMQLAGILSNAGRHADAAPLFHEAVSTRRALIPGDDRELAQSINDEGYTLMSVGRFAEAETLFEESRAMRQRLFPGDDPDVAESLNNLAWSQERGRRPAEAGENYRRALDMYRRLFKGDHRFVSRGLYNLGWNLMEQGHWDEAQALQQEAFDMASRLSPTNYRARCERLSLIGTCELMRGNTADAERSYAKAMDEYRLAKGPEPVSIALMFTSGMVLDLSVVDPARAVALSATLYERARRALPADSPALADDLVIYGTALLATNAPADAERAEPLLRQALKLLPVGGSPNPRVAYAQSLLGGVLVRRAEQESASDVPVSAATLARIRDAEPLVVQGFDGLSSQRDRLSPNIRVERLHAAAKRVADLYALWNRLEPDAARAEKAQRYAKEAEAPIR